MSERRESREVRVEMLGGGHPRVFVDGQDVSEQAVGPDGAVRVEKPGMSLRIAAGAGGVTAPPSLPEAAAQPATLSTESSGKAGDKTQTATVIQTQTVTVTAVGNVTIFLTQNAQVSQNQANACCKKSRRHTS